MWHLQYLTGTALLTINPDQALGDRDADGVQSVSGAELAFGAGQMIFDFLVRRIQFVADLHGSQAVSREFQASDLHAGQFNITVIGTQFHASLVHRPTVQVRLRARLPQPIPWRIDLLLTRGFQLHREVGGL